MSSPGMVITFVTTPDGADPFAAVLQRAASLVGGEEGTTTWIAGRSQEDETHFHVIDLFASPEAQAEHLGGTAAALILGEGSALFAEPPTISMMSVVGTKDGEAGA